LGAALAHRRTDLVPLARSRQVLRLARKTLPDLHSILEIGDSKPVFASAEKQDVEKRSDGIRPARDLLVDPQPAHCDFDRILDHREWGAVPSAGHQFRIRGQANGPRRPAASPGEHSVEDLLGLGEEEIAELVALSRLGWLANFVSRRSRESRRSARSAFTSSQGVTIHPPMEGSTKTGAVLRSSARIRCGSRTTSEARSVPKGFDMAKRTPVLNRPEGESVLPPFTRAGHHEMPIHAALPEAKRYAPRASHSIAYISGFRKRI